MTALVALNTMLPKIDSPFEQQGKALQLRQMMQAGEDADYQRQQRAQAQTDDASYRAALQASGGDSTRMLSALAGAGNVKGYATAQAADLAQRKGNADIDKDKATTEKTRIDVLKEANAMIGSAAGALKARPSYENAVAIVGQLKQRLGPALATQLGLDALEVPRDPVQIAQWADQHYMGAIAADKQLEDARVKAEGEKNRQVQVDNSKRSAASSKYSADSSAAVQRERLNHEKQLPRGQIIQTDDGPMLADPRAGTAQPVIGPDGQPLKPKMKSLPAPIQKALLENDAALRKVDDALAAVDKYPDALGAKNYLGDTIRQRTDAEGIEARALVADIGSLKIHDRSGAAVTAAETPRLKPFIPAATDHPDTVKKKLGLFRKEYEAIQQDINDTYTKENGYRAPAAVKSGKPAAPRAPAAGAVQDGYRFKGGDPAKAENWEKQ